MGYIKNEINLYQINPRYTHEMWKCNNRLYDATKATRPFLGVVFEINNNKYYAPLSTAKLKHHDMQEKIDFIKIEDDKTNQLYGVLNLNNMIPVDDSLVKKIDFNTNPHKYILQKQLNIIISRKDDILGKAKSIYNKVNNFPEENIYLTKRTIGTYNGDIPYFTHLEAISLNYCKEHNITHAGVQAPATKIEKQKNPIAEYCKQNKDTQKKNSFELEK